MRELGYVWEIAAFVLVAYGLWDTFRPRTKEDADDVTCEKREAPADRGASRKRKMPSGVRPRRLVRGFPAGVGESPGARFPDLDARGGREAS